MRYVKSSVILVLAAAVCLLGVGMAQADIVPLFQWHMGDQDGVLAGGAAPATTMANVGGSPANDLALTGSGTVIASTSAQLGVGLTGNVGGPGVPASYYQNLSVDVNPTDVTKWGIDVVVQFNNAATPTPAGIVSLGGATHDVTLQMISGYWALQTPGTIRTSTTKIDANEHHLVMASGDLWLDGTQLTLNGAPANFLKNPAAGITVGAFSVSGALRGGLDGAVSFVRAFEYTGDFDISQVTVPQYQVPEPGTLALLGCGLIGLLAYAWRRRK